MRRKILAAPPTLCFAKEDVPGLRRVSDVLYVGTCPFCEGAGPDSLRVHAEKDTWACTNCRREPAGPEEWLELRQAARREARP